MTIRKYKKVARLESLLESKENFRLLQIAEKREKAPVKDFDEFIAEEGFSKEELEKLAECVEIE